MRAHANSILSKIEMKRTGLRLFLWVNFIQMFGLGFILFQGFFLETHFEEKCHLVQRFLITDYCLSTESRHTRHYLFSEWFAPFQDFAGWYEHFPSSSFFNPPAHLESSSNSVTSSENLKN